MTAIAFTENTLLITKRALGEVFPYVKSAHLTEALAAACGYGTHAALRHDLARQNPSDPDFLLLDDADFVHRLHALHGSPVAMQEDFGWFEHLNYASKEGVIRTRSGRFEDSAYTSTRAKAWRNLMVAAINQGITQRLFTVRSGDNRWPGHDKSGARHAHVFNFEIDGIPGIGCVRDAGWDELSIHAALWPTPKAAEWIEVSNAGFLAGEAFAAGWLERRDGAWLQYPEPPIFRCRRDKLKQLAGYAIRPMGFADRGNFKM